MGPLVHTRLEVRPQGTRALYGVPPEVSKRANNALREAFSESWNVAVRYKSDDGGMEGRTDEFEKRIINKTGIRKGRRTEIVLD